MACCSNRCERKLKCAHHIDNPRETNGWESVEDYYYYGSGSISSEDYEEHWCCGPHGNWEMFTPIDVELLKKQKASLDKLISELEQGIYSFKN